MAVASPVEVAAGNVVGVIAIGAVAVAVPADGAGVTLAGGVVATAAAAGVPAGAVAKRKLTCTGWPSDRVSNVSIASNGCAQ